MSSNLPVKDVLSKATCASVLIASITTQSTIITELEYAQHMLTLLTINNGQGLASGSRGAQRLQCMPPGVDGPRALRRHATRRSAACDRDTEGGSASRKV